MINYSSIMEEAQAVVEKFEEQIELYMDNEPENESSAKYDKWSEGLEKLETMLDLFQHIVDECEYNLK